MLRGAARHIADCQPSHSSGSCSIPAGKVLPFDQFKEAIGESTRAGRGAKVFLGSE